MKLTLRLDMCTYDFLKAISKKKKQSYADAIRDLIRNSLQKEKERKDK